jgi:hypothetical protein
MFSLFCKAAANTGVMIASTTIAHITYSITHKVQNRYILWQQTLPKCSESYSLDKEPKDVNITTPN